MKIALVGRSNVGKSSVFNRLVGRRLAIVDDSLGVTRDRKEGYSKNSFINFGVIDTPGVSVRTKDDLAKRMNEQSFLAVQEADLVCVVIDALDRITAEDKFIAEWLRKAYKQLGNKPTLVIANKCENLKNPIDVKSLGFGDAIYISAEHNINVQELYEKIAKYAENEEEQIGSENAIKIAIVGRPNVGKSTLINAVLGENRLLTGSMAGTTRDAIALSFEFNGQKIQIIDTAGQRQKSKIHEKLENIAVSESWKHIRQANVVIVVLDVNFSLENQDINIARRAIDEGKIVIFAVNKIDTISASQKVMKELALRLSEEFAQVPRALCIPISALDKRNLGTLFVHSIQLYEKWNTRIPTGKLNSFLETAINNYHPPLVNGMPIKLKFMTQTNTRPPSFALISNRADDLPESYKRYLLNRLRDAFDLYSIPLRLFVRTRENPYSKNEK